MTFAETRSLGCFVYFDAGVPARAFLQSLVGELDIEKEAKVSTRNYFLSWKKFSWKTIDAAIDDPNILAITLLVGTPQDVRLAAAIALRDDPAFQRRPWPLLAWLGAESARWPESSFTRLARTWMRIAAKDGNPLSGGALAAANLRNAKVEMTQLFEFGPGEEPDQSPNSFHSRMMHERPIEHARDAIRRVYPTTLLGPKFASQFDSAKLAAAGATNIEHVNGSIIFDATPELHEAWSPEYLAATVELRRLLWPLSFQNPADDPDLRRKSQR